MPLGRLLSGPHTYTRLFSSLFGPHHFRPANFVTLPTSSSPSCLSSEKALWIFVCWTVPKRPVGPSCFGKHFTLPLLLTTLIIWQPSLPLWGIGLCWRKSHYHLRPHSCITRHDPTHFSPFAASWREKRSRTKTFVLVYKYNTFLTINIKLFTLFAYSFVHPS